MYNLPEKVYYPYWFDIVTTGSENDVVSEFKLNTTLEGDSILNEYRLEETFPAVLSHTENYRFYYFAGDFADNTIKTSLAYFSGVQLVGQVFNSKKDANSRQFFWKYYNPLIKNILNTASNLDGSK